VFTFFISKILYLVLRNLKKIQFYNKKFHSFSMVKQTFDKITFKFKSVKKKKVFQNIKIKKNKQMGLSKIIKNLTSQKSEMLDDVF
jgi:hypothetical protein